MVMTHAWCYGLRELPGEIAGKSCVRPLFLPVCFFICLVGTLWKDGGVRFFGIFGSAELDIRAHLMIGWPLKFSMLVGYPWGLLEAPVDFIAVVEHRLIPA